LRTRARGFHIGSFDVTVKTAGRPAILVRDSTDAPILMEIEAIDAVLYLASSPGASERFAAAVRAS